MALASPRRRALTALAGASALALTLAACSGSGSNGNDAGGGEGGTITIGTTDKITTIDPAGSYDNGSFAVMNQVYPFLLNTPYGSPDVEPDIAESAEFTSPTEYTVTLKEGLSFANVVKTTVFMTDLGQFAQMNAVYATAFPANPPARSTIQVAGLPKGASVEIEVIAHY